MSNQNFYALMEKNFPRHDDAVCLLNEQRQPTLLYSELKDHSAKLAGLLGELGLQRGDRVVAQIDKSPQALILYLACLRRGCIFIPLNTAYTIHELQQFVADAEPGLLVCRPENEAGLSIDSMSVLTLAADGTGSLTDRAANASPDSTVAEMAVDDVATILYTSGTTGRSKGAMLTHGNLSSNARALTDTWGWRREDVLLHALPIYHAHGLFVGVHLALFNGSTMIFLPKFATDDVIAGLPNATVFMGVPTFYTRLLACDGFKRTTCMHMRLFISGSAPLLEESFNEFAARTGFTILERYGMTEALMITSNPLAEPRIAGSVGYPLPGVQLRVVDANGISAPAETVGHLQISGPNVFKGYWRQRAKTAEEFTRDGYFRTGDLARISAAGSVTLVGRSKDLIISGGLNVYPKEIEHALDQHDSVIESAVIGIPHPDFGEAVVAIVVPASDTKFDKKHIANFLHGRLAGFKRPKLYMTVDELPRNAMGKVQKKELRDQYAERLSAQLITPST